MPTYATSAVEKLEMDRLVASGYRIRAVQEGLDGAGVYFEHPDSVEQPHMHMQLLTADARKYLAVLLLREQRD